MNKMMMQASTRLAQVSKHKAFQVVFCALLACAMLSIATKSSYLYPFNDWVDVQCFYTVGKGMFNGLVPYLDLAEQKGPYVYLLYGLAWFLEPLAQNPMFGGFVLEVIAGTFFLYFVNQIFLLYCERYTLLATCGVAFVAWRGAAFEQGGSVEELMLPLWAYAMYCMLCVLQEKEINLKKIAALNGFFMGAVFFAKYTLLGVYIGVALALVIWFLLRKEYKNILLLAQWVTVGFLVAVVPWLLYFIWHHALGEFWTWYFYNNIFLYTRDLGVLSRGVFAWNAFVSACTEDGVLACACIAASVGWLIYGCVRKTYRQILLQGLALVCAVFFLYAGGQALVYYSLPLVAVVVPGLAMLLAVVVQYTQAIQVRFLWELALLPLAMVCVVVGMYYTSDNVWYMAYGQEELPQFQFAEIINQSEDPTLINFSGLDIGVYTVADILPSDVNFCALNVLKLEMTQMQSIAIANHQFEFVVVECWYRDSVEASFVQYDYTLVASYRGDPEHLDKLYELYQKNPE